MTPGVIAELDQMGAVVDGFVATARQSLAEGRSEAEVVVDIATAYATQQCNTLNLSIAFALLVVREAKREVTP